VTLRGVVSSDTCSHHLPEERARFLVRLLDTEKNETVETFVESVNFWRVLLLLRAHTCENCSNQYRGTSLIRNSAPVGPYSSPMPRDLWWSYGGGCFL